MSKSRPGLFYALQRPSRETWIALALLACLMAVYTLLALDLAQFRTFWSPDSGVRFWMIRNWVERGNLIDLPYEALPMDPACRLHPLSAGYPGYVAHLEGGLTTIYPPLFPFLCGWFYRLLGFDGLMVVPVLSGLGTVALVTATARRMGVGGWWALVPVTGLATPLVLYSVVFWDHACYMALCAATAYLLYLALERTSRRYAAWAGALLGAGVWFHEFFAALFIAIVLGAVIAPRGATTRKLILPLLGGFAVLVGAWLIVNLWLYGAAAGPHVLGANDPRQPHFLRRILALGWMFRQGVAQLTGASDWAEPMLYLVAWFLICSLIGGRARVLGAVLLIGCAAAFWWFTPRNAWVNGLLDTTPLFIPAIAGHWYLTLRKQGQEAAEAAEIWFARAALAFGGVILITPLGGGIGWGNRAMLTILPLLMLVGSRVVSRELAAAKGFPRVVLGLAVATLVFVSGLSQWRGWQAIRLTLRTNAERVARVSTLPDTLVASDDWLIWAESAAARDLPHSRYILRNRDVDRRQFAFLLERRGTDRFLYLASRQAAENLERFLTDQGLRFQLKPTAEPEQWSFRRSSRLELPVQHPVTTPTPERQPRAQRAVQAGTVGPSSTLAAR